MVLPLAGFHDVDVHVSEDETFFAECFEEKGHSDLGEILVDGRLLHRFQFCCGYDVDNWDGFVAHFVGFPGC
jgi:hypothetical protein